eukprot:2666556-Rhodomonas_salina.1
MVCALRCSRCSCTAFSRTAARAQLCGTGLTLGKLVQFLRCAVDVLPYLCRLLRESLSLLKRLRRLGVGKAQAVSHRIGC